MESEKPLFSNKALKALIIPLILEQILGLTVGMADSIMVSSAGEASVSGVSLVDSINILLINTFTSLSTGGAVVAAHRLGERKKEEAGKTADQLLFCVVGIASLIAVLSLIFNRVILNGIFGGVEEAVMKNAVIYFYITALSFPFLGVYSASAALSRAMGDTKTTMYLSILMNVINISGNAIFILVFRLGVYGVAFSTLLARITAALVMYRIMRNKNRDLCYGKNPFVKPDRKIIKSIMGIGIPTGMDNCIFQVGKILVQSLIAGLGTTAITANAIVGVVAGIAVIPASAMGAAMITVVGQTIGAGAVEEAKSYVKKMMRYSYFFMFLANGIIILFATPIAGLYQVSPETIKLAAEIIIFHSICAVVLWPAGFSLPNAMRAAMDATYTMKVSIGSMWLFRIGLSYLFTLYFKMGLFGIWAAMAVDWVFRAGCFLWRFYSGRWLCKIEKEKERTT